MIALSVGVSVLVPVALVWWVTTRYYVKATPNMAFIRTGWLGRKVVVDGGAFVLPWVQSIRWISLETMKFQVRRANRDAFITRDRYRVDVLADFYMKVEPDPLQIERASRSLGERSLNPDSVRELVEDKLVSALRSVAASRTLLELHENRAEFARAVQQMVAEVLALNGLTLEAVAIAALDQTPKEQLDPNNIFDAEGLRQITLETSARLKERNDIERDTEVAMKQKDVDATKQKLALEVEHEFALAEHRRRIDARKAEEAAGLAQFRFAQELATRQAEIEKERRIRETELEREIQLLRRQEARERADIDRERQVALARIQKETDVARLEREAAIAVLEREMARLEQEQKKLVLEAERARTAEQVATAQAVAQAEREAAVARIGADRDLLVARLAAEAADARAQEIVRVGEAHAQARLKAVEAENATALPIVERELLLRLIERAPEIVDKLVEPARRIESIRVLSLAGLDGRGATSEGGSAGLGAVAGGTLQTILSSIVGAGAALPVLKELLHLYQGDAQAAIEGLKEKGPRLAAIPARDGSR